jgi:hypothetical protein
MAGRWPIEGDDVAAQVESLGTLGLLQRRPDAAETTLSITAQGRTFVEALRELINDPDGLDAACRDALLFWLNKLRRSSDRESWPSTNMFFQTPSIVVDRGLLVRRA